MDKPKTSANEMLKALEITHAYAEYKIRHAGDLDNDLSDWTSSIQHFIENEKAKK